MREAPKYRRICEELKSEILGGKYGGKIPFPSEVALSRRFKTGRSTVKRALDELQHLGFIRSQQGRGTFVTPYGASRRIGLIVPGVAYLEFFPPIVSEINRLARESGYTLLFGEVYSPDETTRLHQVRELAAEFVHRRVAGVIYQPIEGLPDSRNANDRILSVFRKAKIPVVLLDSDIAPLPERSAYDVVGINDVEAGMRLATHLLAAGARKIHYLIGRNSAAADANRYLGIQMAVDRSKTRPKPSCSLVIASPDDADAIRRVLRKGKPDAFICGNDCLAAILCRTLESLGRSVPRDILLAGFGDLQISRLMTPRLTSVHQSVYELARIAFSRLLERIGKPDLMPIDIFLPSPLVVRASTDRS